MSIASLIAHLQNLLDHGSSPDTVVRIFDPDSMAWESVTGSVIDPEKNTLDLYCDD